MTNPDARWPDAPHLTAKAWAARQRYGRHSSRKLMSPRLKDQMLLQVSIRQHLAQAGHIIPRHRAEATS